VFIYFWNGIHCKRKPSFLATQFSEDQVTIPFGSEVLSSRHSEDVYTPALVAHAILSLSTTSYVAFKCETSVNVRLRTFIHLYSGMEVDMGFVVY